MRTRTGFTLVELLVVTVVIGLLAAIAIPNFRNTKGKANAVSLRSDLRNIAAAQEAYFNESGTYTTNLALLGASTSPGVIVTFGVAMSSGWSAKVTHPQAYPIECGLFIGNAPPLAPAITEGQVLCQ